MPENICGEATGSDGNGPPCQRQAGWGTESDIGPCKDHAEDYVVPDKLTEETKNQLIGAAQQGAFKRHCAQTAGLRPRTLRRWLSWGEDHCERGIDSELAEFYVRFQQARGAGAVRRLKDADDEFVLERSYGYTKTERHEHLVDDDQSLDAKEGVTAQFVTYEDNGDE